MKRLFLLLALVAFAVSTGAQTNPQIDSRQGGSFSTTFLPVARGGTLLGDSTWKNTSTGALVPSVDSAYPIGSGGGGLNPSAIQFSTGGFNGWNAAGNGRYISGDNGGGYTVLSGLGFRFSSCASDLGCGGSDAALVRDAANIVGIETNVAGQGGTYANTGLKVSRFYTSSTLPPTPTATGVGGSPTLAIDTGSTDTAGIITITAGTAPGATGTITLSFSAAFGTNSPVCIANLMNGTGSWQLGAVVILNSSANTACVWNWDNHTITGTATNLINTSTYKLAYQVVGK